MKAIIVSCAIFLSIIVVLCEMSGDDVLSDILAKLTIVNSIEERNREKQRQRE
jgi:hypothetical protein